MFKFAQSSIKLLDKFNPRLIPNQNNDADIWTPADWNDLFISFFPLHLSFLSPSLFLLPSFIFLCLFIYLSLHLSLTFQFSFSSSLFRTFISLSSQSLFLLYYRSSLFHVLFVSFSFSLYLYFCSISLPDHLRIQPKSSSQSKLEISFSDLPK
jgi:hypothetical protein